jgi:transcription antitermination factor NusG
MSQWYAIRTEPNRENRVEWVMRERFGLTVYIPRITELVTVEMGQWQREKFDLGEDDKLPLTDVQTFRGSIVPGFLFIQADMTDALANGIANSPYVIRLMPNNFRPLPIEPESIDFMKAECERLVRQTGDTPDLDWMLGKTFKVEKGKWADRAGFCIAFDRKGQPVIEIEVFKARYLPVGIPLDEIDLNPIDDTTTQDVVAAFTSLRYKKMIKTRKRGAAA